VFKVPPDFPSGGISTVPGILMKQAEHTRGVFHQLLRSGVLIFPNSTN